jgi:predicted permease
VDAKGPVRRLFRLGVGEPGPAEAVTWEIEHHLDETVERLVEEGWDPDEARREAERRFGRERYGPRLRRMERRRKTMRKTTRGWTLLREGLHGTLRGLRQRPGFVAGVVATLALGIGANAAMFGIVDRLLLRPPAHVRDHEEVRRVIMARDDWVGPTITYPDFVDLRSVGGFEGVAAFTPTREMTSGSGPDASRLQATLVSHEFFPLLGARPVLGRTFTAEEDRPEADPTVVLGHEYWESAFGADRDVLGRSLELAGDRYTIIGVAPSGFTGVGLERVDAWLPIETAQALARGDTRWKDGEQARGHWWMAAVARLGDGVTAAAAAEEATGVSRNARREDLERGRWEAMDIRLWPLIAAQGPEASAESRVAKWLGGVSLIVLLIACANVANLLLARGARRRREVAVRLALGVSRGRLVGAAMLESVLLALGGGAVGLLLARWGGEVLRRVLLSGVHFPGNALDARVVGFTAVVSVLAGLLAGLGPALQSTRLDLSGDLSEGRRGSSLRRSRARGGLIVAQAALTVVLLVGAGLFVRSLEHVRSLDLGLDVDRVALSRLELVDDDTPVQERNDVYRAALERVAALPGVASATATNAPFQWGFAGPLEVPGVDSIPRLPGGGPYYYAVTPGYFETLGLDVERGRAFDGTDGATAAPVALVSRTMAESLWPGGDPLGRCLLVGRDAETCTTVVGVVEDASRGSIETEPYMAYYLPVEQTDMRLNGLYVRASGDVDEVLEAAAGVLRTFSPRVRWATASTLREILDPQARSWTLGATMFTVFGLLALLVAAVGLYSLLAFEVAQRTREMGIRSALGAGRTRLLGDVVTEGVRLIGLGILLGLATAWFVAPRVEELLFDVPARDPAVLLLVTGVLAGTAVLASFVPGLRATRVDPAGALRAS